MGLFDYVSCKYPLPVPGANDIQFQTKDTDCPYMEWYEIREDGTLWREVYDTEDRSDPNATGLMRICGMQTRVNERWEPEELTGELVCSGYIGNDYKNGQRVEFSAYFVGGKLKHMEQLCPATAPAERR